MRDNTLSINPKEHGEKTSSPARHVLPPSSPSGSASQFTAYQSAGNLAIQRLLNSRVIQPKLTIGQSDDADEQEADRVADNVTAATSGSLVHAPCRACALGRACGKCQNEVRIQSSRIHGHTPALSTALESSLGSLRARGQPLAASTRSFFEPRFGHDLSEVRVHTDPNAAESAAAIAARAYTTGRNIVFAAGAYKPNTSAGQRLLAHELAHVFQQSSGLRDTSNHNSPHIQRQISDEALAFRDPTYRREVQAEATAQASARPAAAVAVPSTLPTVSSELSELIRRVNVRFEVRRMIQERDLLGVAIEDLIGGHRERDDEPIALNQTRLGASRSERAQFNQFTNQIPALLASVGVRSVDELESAPAQLITAFENHARAVTLFILSENEQVARRESLRYQRSQEGDPQSDVRRLREAARELGALQTDIRRRESDPSTVDHASADVDFDTRGPGGGNLYRPSPRELPHLDPLLDRNRNRFDNLKTVYGSQFPILLTENLDYAALANASPQALRSLIEGKVAEVLTNVEQTRAHLRSGDLSIWSLPPIIQRTKQELGVRQGSGADAAIQERAQSSGAWTSLALAALGIGLGILASVASGGLALLALIGSAGLSLYSVGASFQQYSVETAAHGTALDRAAAERISAEEPTLLWLALDIIGAVTDVRAAGAAFRNLSRAARLARTATAIEDLEELARAQAHVLGQEGRLSVEAGGQVEQAEHALVDRVTSSARQHANESAPAAGHGVSEGERAAAQTPPVETAPAGVVESSARASTDLLPAEIDAELAFGTHATPVTIADGDYIAVVALPNSNHRWQLHRHGYWCRFSDGEYCLVTVGHLQSALVSQAAAEEIRQRLGQRFERSVVGTSPHLEGAFTISGYSGPARVNPPFGQIHPTEESLLDVEREMVRRVGGDESRARARMGIEASGEAGFHTGDAERQIAVLLRDSDLPVQVSAVSFRNVCDDCQRYFPVLAAHQQRVYVIGDPGGVNIFGPNQRGIWLPRNRATEIVSSSLPEEQRNQMTQDLIRRMR